MSKLINAQLADSLSLFAEQDADINPEQMVEVRADRAYLRVTRKNAAAVAKRVRTAHLTFPRGGYKRAKADRHFPTFKPGMSTVEYLALFADANKNNDVHVLPYDYKTMPLTPSPVYEGGALDFDAIEELNEDYIDPATKTPTPGDCNTPAPTVAIAEHPTPGLPTVAIQYFRRGSRAPEHPTPGLPTVAIATPHTTAPTLSAALDQTSTTAKGDPEMVEFYTQINPQVTQAIEIARNLRIKIDAACQDISARAAVYQSEAARLQAAATRMDTHGTRQIATTYAIAGHIFAAWVGHATEKVSDGIADGLITGMLDAYSTHLTRCKRPAPQPPATPPPSLVAIAALPPPLWRLQHRHQPLTSQHNQLSSSHHATWFTKTANASPQNQVIGKPGCKATNPAANTRW